MREVIYVGIFNSIMHCINSPMAFDVTIVHKDWFVGNGYGE